MIHINKLKLSIMGLAILAAWPCVSQTKIGTTAGPGDPSAVLELQSNNQGFLHPRLTTTQRDAIASPAVGLTIYNTTVNCLQMYKGAGNGGWYDLCNVSTTPGGGALAFTNCGTPVISGSFAIAQATTATVTLNYTNSTGQTHASFASGTANGITFTVTGGSVTPITAGSGSIVLTASGTPTASGSMNVPVVLGGAACDISITVAGCSDPGATPGNTGCVTFSYRGQQVTYTTVRAKDNKIWLQQNLGASRVATSVTDVNAYGDFFQWGRWDDGHQALNSTPQSTILTTNNPTGISSGSADIFPSWWIGGANTDTWSSGAISATNGKDPCAAIGSGWRMPTAAEWVTMKSSANENITNISGAFASNLKIPASGWREGRPGFTLGQVYRDGTRVDFWSSTTATGSNVYEQVIAGTAPDATTTPTARSMSYGVRCVKP